MKFVHYAYCILMEMVSCHHNMCMHTCACVSYAMHAKMMVINGSLSQPLKAQKLVLRAIISGILKEARHHTHKHSSTKDYLRVHLILIEV